MQRSFIYKLIFLLALAQSCSPAGKKGDGTEAEPQVRFVLEQWKHQQEEAGGPSWPMPVFELDSLGLKPQQYEIEAGRRRIRIRGGDASGLMYGGLEALEQLQLFGRV